MNATRVGLLFRFSFGCFTKKGDAALSAVPTVPDVRTRRTRCYDHGLVGSRGISNAPASGQVACSLLKAFSLRLVAQGHAHASRLAGPQASTEHGVPHASAMHTRVRNIECRANLKEFLAQDVGQLFDDTQDDTASPDTETN